MYLPSEIFTIILEYNGVVNYFPKKLINFLRHCCIDDLTKIVENVLQKRFQFTHKQMSMECRKIVLKDVFMNRSCKDIFIKLMNQYEMYRNIHSFKNYEVKVGDEFLWIRYGITYCGIVKKINEKSLKLDCYDFEIKLAKNWEGRMVEYKYWNKKVINKHISFTQHIKNIHINNPQTVYREDFIRVRKY